MSSSNFTTLQFLDDLKQGWGVKYGPTLQGCGLDDLDDAQDLSEGDLDGLLGRALRAIGAPTLHVARIVKRLYLVNNTKQGNTSNPFSLLPATNITIALNPNTGRLSRSAPTTCARSTNDRADSALQSSMVSESKPGNMPNLKPNLTSITYSLKIFNLL
jgi:hypothetical protein